MTVETRPAAVDRFATREERVDGRLKVTGAVRYLADLIPPDSLWLAYVRSPFAHARVVSVDAEAARRMPGVHAVISGTDIAPVRFGRRLQDWPVLADGRVRFIGDRVAAVAGATPQLAAAAAAAVEVDYEELPAILDAASALDDSAPILHPDAASYAYLGGTRQPVPHPNVQGQVEVSKGDPDIEPVLARAARVFEHRFTTARQHQGHLEPHGASVKIEADGTVRVWTTNKSPFQLRTQMARALALDPETIVVDSGSIGGDFGGKGLSLDECACYLLARATGRQVSAVMSYADELQAANPRHGSTITLRTGVDADGRIVAHSARFLFDGGAYAAGKPIPDLMPPGPLTSLGAYDIPDVRIEAVACYTNTVPAGHMRSPGEVQTAFAGESHMDAIARELGLDPIDFRRRNAARPGSTDVAGRAIRDPRTTELLDAIAADRERRASEAAGRVEGASAVARGDRRVGRVGRGVALTARHMEGGRMSIRLRAHADGTIDIRTGIPDQGGGAHTMMRRVAGAVLDLPEDRFRVIRETTLDATADLGVGASRVTFVGSRAVAAAAERLRDAFEALAATGGTLTGDDVLEAEGSFDSEDYHGTPQDFTFAAYDIEVEVDERTGAVRVTDALLVADVGTIINPVSHRGQLDGGFAFGIGAALLEELGFEDGRVTTVHLGDYKLPTMLDVPSLRTIELPPVDGRGAFGAKMAGELSTSGVAPAVANAVADAVGVRVAALPIRPEAVLAALAARDGASGEGGAAPEAG